MLLKSELFWGFNFALNTALLQWANKMGGINPACIVWNCKHLPLWILCPKYKAKRKMSPIQINYWSGQMLKTGMKCQCYRQTKNLFACLYPKQRVRHDLAVRCIYSCEGSPWLWRALEALSVSMPGDLVSFSLALSQFPSVWSKLLWLQ